GHKHTVWATLSKKAADNCVVCTSPSKTFNLAGLQFSNIIIPNKKLRAAFKSEIDKTGYDEPNLMGIAAATAAYSDGAEWFDQAKDYIWKNIQFAKKYLEEHCPKIRAVEPQGTYLLWLDFSAFKELSDKEISDRILNKAKVWLDDGRMFGSEGKKFQRINCATPRSILQEALKRICAEFN
ncbi:MAG: aminotransferase class I/II-fold pyridoxal phosphate-dependent enzyme, partial [Treponema sp.]|nr:aminotransferase class I/II-fold pyridoxal phosphate-dependent enzyme [Treponema sp.]